MNVSSSRPVNEIISSAIERGLLNRQDGDRLIREAECRGVNPTDLAIEQGLLQGAQIELLQALAYPDRFIPGYEILDLIGSGAVGVVYRARQKRLDRVVALKTIDSRRFNDSRIAARCQLEAKIVARLSHPNIVTAYDYGVHDGRVYLAMELLDGVTLQDRIDREGPLEEHLAWAIVRQIAAGLAYAAEHEIVHRDIKPANIMLVKPSPGMEGPPGVPLAKITDFGLALQLNSIELTRLTATGTLLGTVAYAAPEQLSEPNVDCRADIFALGATLYHMLSGAGPYATVTSISSVIVAKQTGNEPWRDQLPTHLTPATAELLSAMTMHHCSERVGDYGWLIDRIDAILAPGRSKVALAPKSGTTRVHPSQLTETLDLPNQQPDRRAESVRNSRSALRGKRSAWAAVAVLAALIAFGAIVMYVPLSFSTNRESPRSTEPDLLPSAFRQPLFNGESVPIGTQRGNWKVTKAGDGGRVLSGNNGWLDLVLPPPPSAGARKYFVLRLGMQPLAAAEAELQFGLATNEKDESRYVITLAKGLAQIGRRSGIDAPLEPLAAVAPLPLQARSDESPVYQNIQVQRQPNRWVVAVNGVMVADLPHNSEQGASAILLVVRNGAAHFADLEVSELVSQDRVGHP